MRSPETPMAQPFQEPTQEASDDTTLTLDQWNGIWPLHPAALEPM